LIVRLRLFAERLGWKRILLAALGVVALVAAGAVFAVVRGGGGDGAGKSTGSTASEANTNLFYLRALPPKVRVSGCVMNIRFTWRPDYQADRYMGAPAAIVATGTGIEGTYRRPFKAKGVSLDVGPIPLGGGYRVWTASVASLEGEPPGNDTTIQAAPPANTKCD
jgi:hypothetical protein